VAAWLAAGAIAPVAGAGIAAMTGSYRAMFAVLAAIAATGAVLAGTPPSPAKAVMPVEANAGPGG